MLYPLSFKPIYKEKVWGGRSFETLGRELPGDATAGIGESWEIADLATTSVSGGGGNAEHSVVDAGPLVGKTIRQLIEQHGDALLGTGIAPAADGGFPLLIKFLDAKENLSVQVHPSPDYAAGHPEAHLKSEAWYVIDAQPGAVIYKGLARGVTADQLRASLQANTDEAVVPLLNAIEVKPGDCHYLPSGTLHALGAGVLVAEVQTPSDTTYRVYDWGRTDRELHIEQAMACIDFGQADPAVAQVGRSAQGFSVTPKAACEYFRIDELASEVAMQIPRTQQAAEIMMGMSGQASVSLPEGGEPVSIAAGHTVLLPASLGTYLFAAQPGSRVLHVTLPMAAR